ncbi:MAG: hypothetical protein O3A38_02115 [Proteobacteria bacterium]|nr:hypothetical protein [Pseudomonadota bacterium]
MKTQHPLTPDQIVAYHRDGYLHIPGFFDAAEIAPVQPALRDDPGVGGRLATVHDGSAKTQHDYLGWTRHGDDWLGVTTRLARLVEGAATLIGEPVYEFDIGRDAWRALSPAQKAERLDEVRGIYDRITQSFLNSENGVSTVNLMEYETRVIEKGDYDEWLK